MLAILTGCARFSEPVVMAPTYPARPPFMAPVDVPPIAAGDDARLALAKRTAALTTANDRLTQSADWYDNLVGLR